MKRKRGVLLPIWISSMLLAACGNQDSVPASVAELTPIEIKPTEGPAGSGDEGIVLDGAIGTNGENGVPKSQQGTGGEGGALDGTIGTNGENGVPESQKGTGGEGSALDGTIGTNGEPGASEGQTEGGNENPAQNGTIGISGENTTESGNNSQTQPNGSQEQEIKITISAAGDVTMGNYIGQGYEISFRQTYDKGAGDSYFFENVFDIFSQDDLTLVNLEGPLTRSEDFREEQTYCISGDPEYVNILTAGSVEAVSMANNHRLDYKEQGTRDTVEALEGAGILYAYDNNYCMYETQGIQIGIVSVNEVGQGAGVEKYLQDGITQLRQQGADLVFACCHWGIEREYYPEDYQKSLGKKCIDWGYDLVIGHHPHVLQGIEEYQGKFILYSLGNFCFGANRNPPDKDCMIFQQTFTFLDGEKQENQDIRVIPCSVSSVADRNDYKPTPSEGEEAQRILDKINECSQDFGLEFDADGYLILGQ